ncbi:hypothetical protein QE152_g26013 [Popillia japonica]|uniref:Uncharacterized protein n=1 Tax=Popillia japonica TaxID=7064 RepID=A0AAW1K0K6_POPJA
MQYLLVWGHSTHLQKVFKVQTRCIGLIAGIDYDADCRNAFIELNILTTPCVYILECVVFVKENINNYRLNKDYHGYFTRSNENINNYRLNKDYHGYFTRSNDCISPKYHRLSISIDGVSYFAINLFNILPETVKKLPETIEELLKNYLGGL